MKKIILAAAVAAGCMFSANAQNTIERPTVGDNWQIGLDLGATTPLKGKFIKNFRYQNGVHIQKQFTPVTALGVEGAWGVNTTKSANVFDTQYVGPYAAWNLTNLFGGFTCTPRVFDLNLVTGAGWLHNYNAHAKDVNNLGLKFGLAFNFNVSDHFSIAVKPDVVFNVTGKPNDNVAFYKKGANFDVMVGFNYNINPGFKCVECPDYSAEIADLNAQINAARADLDATNVALAASTADNAALAAALAQCQAQEPQVVQKNTLESVRYVFFKLGSSVITADQMPNVEMIAAYLKNHPDSKVEIKGYASPDGSIEVNERLANQRAESVKNALVKKYKISADRITAKGEGIGHMFSEESWNRVSICTLED